MSSRAALVICGAGLWLGCAGAGTGGAPGTGGASESGGISGSGGKVGSGGDPGGGGVTGTGGAIASGGSGGDGLHGSGGAIGSGGMGRGGAGVAGRSGSGGVSGTAGASSVATGGTTGGGGAMGSGGTTGAGAAGQSAGGASGAAGSSGAGGAACPGDAYDATHPPQALTLSGSLGAHDPAALVDGADIYLYATGLVAKTSSNLTTWTAQTNPLNPLPSWIATSVPGATNLWAPDISFFGGQYHLYYAASTFGSNTSCIGQATRASLTSGSWSDQGSVICSNVGHTGDDWNAIDPNVVVVDAAGTPWLAFGSFWGGIKMIELDTTGARADTTLHAIAARPSAGGALEGAWVFRRCGLYYLFTSWGSCCSSPYDYNIRVGRGTNVTGPYLDKDGTDLMKGGGTLLVQGNTSWVAPGHNAVITYAGKTYNLYHALQGSSTGPATLRISELTWDPSGWPISAGP